MSRALSVLALTAAAVVLSVVSVHADKIISMPGLDGPLPSAMDSGYITVDETNGRAMFYMFAESQRSPSADPLVLWLTGGPGCSSLWALFTENGPFNMNYSANAGDSNIKVNPYSWTTAANMIYLESPAGVGFSYSNTTSDYVTGDKRTANDTYAFLQGFLAKFPQFRNNEFYVTGESYGGHYVPEAVYKVYTENQKQPVAKQINIKGHMVGNPWTDPETEAFGVIDNWWDRAIISERVYADIHEYCGYRDITKWIINNVTAMLHGARYDPNHREKDSKTQKCFDALKEGSMVQFGGVDILGVYLDVCNKGTKGNIPDQPNYCATQDLTNYLNRPDVQAAIHVRNPPQTWASCSLAVTYNAEDTQTSVLPIYKFLTEETDLRVWVYSGDNDAIVPYTGTRRWLRVLNRKIINDVHQWWADTNGPQVGGWAVEYDRLFFTTVRGAGHMVPYMKPHRALHLFTHFLQNKTL